MGEITKRALKRKLSLVLPEDDDNDNDDEDDDDHDDLDDDLGSLSNHRYHGQLL